MPYIQYKCPICGNTTFDLFDKFDWVGYDNSCSGYEGDRSIIRCAKCHRDMGWYFEADPTQKCTLESVDQIMINEEVIDAQK